MTGTWPAPAEGIADAARELGFDVAATVASAWQARCDPGATRSLIEAANVLTSGEGLPRLWERVAPCPSARAFLSAAQEHEADTVVLAKRARNLTDACTVARDDAVTSHGLARQRAIRAQAMLASGHPAPAAQAELEAACEAAERLRQVIGDCDAALDVIVPVLECLGYAVSFLRLAPEDFAETFGVPLAHVRDGGTLPWSGDFLTGASPRLSG